MSQIPEKKELTDLNVLSTGITTLVSTMPSTTGPRNMLDCVRYQSHLQGVNIVRVGGKFRLKEHFRRNLPKEEIS